MIGVLLAWPASILLLSLYRCAVRHAMRKRSDHVGAAPPPSTTSPAETYPPLSIITLDSHSETVCIAEPASAYGQATRSLNRTALIYSLGGLGFAIVLAVAAQLTADGTLRPYRFLLLTAYYGWPVVLTLGIVIGMNGRRRIVIPSLYFALVFAVTAITVMHSPTLSLGEPAIFG